MSCEGLARVDFFYTPAGQILINEINTIPGLSPASYFQKMWEASGLPFGRAHRPAPADGPEEAPRPALTRPGQRRVRVRAPSERELMIELAVKI